MTNENSEKEYRNYPPEKNGEQHPWNETPLVVKIFSPKQGPNGNRKQNWG